MRPKPPAKLYKYMDAGRSSFFTDWMIRFSQPSVLNDPFELKPHISDVATVSKIRRIARQKFNTDLPNYKKIYNKNISQREKKAAIKKLKRENSLRITQAIEATRPKSLAQARSAITEKLEEHVASLCLSETYSDLLMWAHYAGGHQGFVIEFDTTSSFLRQLTPPNHIQFDAAEIEAFLAEYGAPREIDYHSKRPATVATKLNFDLLLIKSVHWEYEEEWRMLMPPDYANYWKFPDKPDDPFIFLFEVPPSCITGIIIGCNAGNSLKSQILDLRNNSATGHIQIQQAEIDDIDYKLNFQIV